MLGQLSSKGIRIPDRFATTAAAFSAFPDVNELARPLQELMGWLNRQSHPK
ncbi:hypothetical protein V9K67_15295 [Paraflavisolibacter sp. H34]|uniref:hypothetical protein n=1 Tax=Huijunlia imazamoxiresistens TaxID=3127457 RepID=UPI003015B7C3